ncbi:MAG: hypothetical protein IJX53_03545 [Clostridia bacterium]|nr:hypothetical protein [Clostridia bacterium]
MKHRVLCSILAALLLLPTLAACGRDGTAQNGSGTTAPVADTATTPVETEPETTAPSLEEILGFAKADNGGRPFTILSNSTSSYEFNVDALTGDVVSDAVFKKDQMVEEYLGIDLKIILENGSWAKRSGFNSKITQAVNSNDATYDLVSNMLVCTLPLAASGAFIDGNELPHVNFDQPWWLADMYERFSVSGKLYGFLGDASLSLYKDMSVVFFNKAIWEAQKPDANLYELVRNNEWTLDKFIELCSDMSRDLNGDGQYDSDNDQLTYFGEHVPNGTWHTALNLQLIEYDENGTPTYTGLTERFDTAYRKLANFRETVPGIKDQDSAVVGQYTPRETFAAGRVATMTNFIYTTEYIRDMEDDYGIVPIPKYDQNQEKYITQIGTSTSTLFVPKTVSDIALTSKVMECEAYFGYTEVSPKYYEVALKTKYASDADMQEMLDIIRDGATIDFLFVHGTALMNTPYQFFRYANIYPSLASAFKALDKSFEASLDKMTAAYAALN